MKKRIKAVKVYQTSKTKDEKVIDNVVLLEQFVKSLNDISC
tara:strand:- start:2441 stop:2563 length:123 start_codon:yes stop_codon:yes gene_type:complete